MYYHIIVSRKDQNNKIKLSPLTNHRNTKKGAINGGFDRVNLFQQIEKGFDKFFSYTRPLEESFEYYNIMKNSNIVEQLKIREEYIRYSKKIEKKEQVQNKELQLDDNTIQSNKVEKMKIKQ